MYFVVLAAMCSPAAAQTWTGTISTDWTNPANWSGGAVPTAAGTVVINTMTPNSTVLGVSGAATGTTGNTVIGNSVGSGGLLIQNGSTLTSGSGTFVEIGTNPGSTGAVAVTGAGSTWTMNVGPQPQSFRLGNQGAGTLNIQDSGTVSVTGGTSIGFGAGGSGTLTIESGGTMTNTTFVHVGGNAGTTGVATVTGPNSLLLADRYISIGLVGNGTLNIQDGGTVKALGAPGDPRIGTIVADFAISTGELNITGGTLETLLLRSGLGTAQVNFDGGTLRATASRPDFITGFSGTELNIEANGLIVDTAGFTVETDATSAFTGTGGLTKAGAGLLSLEANNTYTGVTSILSGTLALSGAGAVTTSSKVVADGTFDISGVTPAGTGIQSLAGGGAVTLGGKTLTITAANDAFSGVISGTGGLTVSGGTQVLSGANTYGGGTTISGGILQLGNGGMSGSIVGDVLNNGTLAFNRSDTLSFGGVISGGGTIRQIGSGLTNLTGDSSGFTGATSVEAGTLAVNGKLCGDVNVLSGGRLQGIGTVCDTANFIGGTVAPGNSIGILTVNGNYTGNGGLLEIETVLGDDASLTDRLVVTGNTAGTTNVKVINVGGTGAQTVEGIKIVDVGGASNGVFALQGDYVFQGQQAVVGGAYAYTLQKNGIADPADGNWYLRSSLTESPADGPIFQPGVPLYESYGQILLGLNGLPTFQQRVGDRYRDGGGSGSAVMAYAAGPVLKTMTEGTSERRAFWGRIDGQHSNLRPSTSTGSTYDADQFKLQTGLDGLLVDNPGGRLFGGLTAHYRTVSADVASIYGNGKISTTGYGIGSTLTWLDERGFYVDGVAQATWYNNDLSSVLAGGVADDNAFGYALSVESGRRIDIGGAWALTPQAQLVYSSVDFDFTDKFGAPVSLTNGDSLIGRLGVSADYKRAWLDQAGEPMRSNLYGIANLYYEFLDGTEVEVAGLPFTSDMDRLWGGVGVGGKYSWAGARYSLYGEALVDTSLDNFGDSYRLSGTAGFRITF